MNGERGTFRLCDSPGCPDGFRSVGRSDLHTGAGFFYDGCPEEEPQARLVEKRLSNLEEECIGQFRAGLL